MFTQEGYPKVRIVDVVFADPKFAKGANDFDICIKVESVEDPTQADWWRGEMSQNYGRGNFATMTQTQITGKTLRKLGYDGSDLTTLKDQIVGKETVACIKASESNGNTYYNVKYLGDSDYAPVALDASTVNSRFAALVGQAPQAAPAPAPKQAAPAAAPSNPFASAPAAGVPDLPF